MRWVSLCLLSAIPAAQEAILDARWSGSNSSDALLVDISGSHMYSMYKEQIILHQDVYINGWNSYIYYRHGQTVSKCMEMCDGESKCKGISDHRTEAGGTCYFKVATGPIGHGTNCDTYLKGGPGPHPSPAACAAGWPLFQSDAALDADPWGNYFRKVYGALPKFSYPLCIGDIWFFYDDIITQTGASAPSVAGNCPSFHAPDGQRYVQNNAYQPAHISYSWHAPPYGGFAASTWAEVDHQKDPFGDEHYGMWLMWAKGSGIWFQTGNTKVFDEHKDAYNFFGAVGNEVVCQAAANSGYDSIQFTKHVDHVNYPCDGTVGAPYMGLEIAAVKLTGTYACGSTSGSHFRAGWMGARDCQCDNAKSNVNCVGFGAESSHSVVV